VNPFSEKVLVNVPKLTFRAEALSTKLFKALRPALVPWSDALRPLRLWRGGTRRRPFTSEGLSSWFAIC